MLEKVLNSITSLYVINEIFYSHSLKKKKKHFHNFIAPQFALKDLNEHKNK